jgi:hypothetical protein
MFRFLPRRLFGPLGLIEINPEKLSDVDDRDAKNDTVRQIPR